MPPGSILLETLGFVAAILTTLCFLPQALRIRRLGAEDISLIMYLMLFLGQALWLTYSILIVSPSMIAANVASMTLVAWVLVMKVQDVRRRHTTGPAPAE